MDTKDVVILTLSLVGALYGWAFKQLWNSKPSYKEMVERLEREIDKASSNDIAADAIMLEAIRVEIRAIKEIRNEDHQLLLEIYRMVRGVSGSMP